MCGLCGDLSPADHWADRGENVRGTRHRLERLAAVRALTRGTGLTVREWQGRGYLIANGRGQVVLVRDLGQLWSEAERMLGRPVDPLIVPVHGA